MAEPTVFEMEIEGVVHPIEDKTARAGLLTPVVNTDNEITALTSADGTSLALADATARAGIGTLQTSIQGIDGRLQTAETTLATFGSVGPTQVFPTNIVGLYVLTKKVGPIAYVHSISGDDLTLPGGYLRLMTLPAGFKPFNNGIVGQALVDQYGTVGQVRILSTGDIYINFVVQRTGAIWFDFAYPTA